MKRELGCAAGSSAVAARHSLRSQLESVPAGGSDVIPSHQTSFSSVSATLVKIVLLASVFIAFGLVAIDVPGATPKKPASGLIA